MTTKKTPGDWSTTASTNTTIDGANVDEGCPPSGINNAIRSLMAGVSGFATAVSTSGTNTYTATLSPAPDALATNFVYLANVATASTSTAPTINFNSFGAKTVFLGDGTTALVSGDLNGLHWFVYDGTNLRVLNPRKSNSAVAGPASSTDGDVALFSGTGGGTLQDSGFTFGTLLRGYIAGLTLSNDGTTPNTVIDIAAGTAMDDGNATMMNTAAITKTTAAWAVGSGNGGLDTGSVASSTGYHVYLIKRTDTGIVDALLSTSASAPTMPTNYTKKRRIGWIKTDGSAHILTFTQIGDWFFWKASVVDANAVSASATPANKPMSVPSGIQVMWRGIASYAAGAAGHQLWVYNNSMTDEVASASEAVATTASANTAAIQTDVWTDTGQNVRVVADSATGTYSLRTIGWMDYRGRFS